VDVENLAKSMRVVFSLDGGSSPSGPELDINYRLFVPQSWGGIKSLRYDIEDQLVEDLEP
jgi:hypothetical protein